MNKSFSIEDIIKDIIKNHGTLQNKIGKRSTTKTGTPDGWKISFRFYYPKGWAFHGETLQFIERQPQHIIRRTKTSMEVLWHLPEGARTLGTGTSNPHRDFISLLPGRQVLGYMPSHDLAKLSLSELRKHPSVKGSVGGFLQGSALTTSAPSLQIKTESVFDRLLLLVFGRYLAIQNIPEAFLKSSYFTGQHALLIQLFTEDPQGFRARIEEPPADEDIRLAILRDHKDLVNSVNQQFLSRYPFEVVAQAEIDFRDRGFRLADQKLGDTVLSSMLSGC